MSLREKLIEAGASVITIDMDTWEEDEIAAVILDAFLDCLAENADEWERLYGIEFEEGRVRSIARHLIDLLRESDV